MSIRSAGIGNTIIITMVTMPTGTARSVNQCVAGFLVAAAGVSTQGQLSERRANFRPRCDGVTRAEKCQRVGVKVATFANAPSP
jgi:hypothetical protein